MKKLFCILLALALLLSLAACGGETDTPTTNQPAQPSSPAATGDPTAGEFYDTGNFKVLVPDGWKAFPQHDLFNEDPNAMNPNIIQIGKGAASDIDLYSKPAITISYAGRGTTMMAPSRSFYDDVEDMADVTTGDHIWSAFSCVSMGQKLYMLFEDQGKIQFQAAVTYETSGGNVSLDDADVQAILASLASTNAEDIAASEGESASGETAASADIAGTWTGLYTKLVGDDDSARDTSASFTLELRSDGTGTHHRDDLDLDVTWKLDGDKVSMTETFLGSSLDYTGEVADGLLHLFNGDPADIWTCEYVYGQGDVSLPPVESGSAEGLSRFRGDWNGALGFRACKGIYEYLDGVDTDAAARFAVRDDGSIDAFIGIYVQDTPFVNLTARYDDFWECLKLSGSWINIPFEDVPMTEENGTLSVVIPLEIDTGSVSGAVTMVINLRRLDDEGWTNEDPRLSEGKIEYCKGMAFEELAELLGYDSGDYPSPDEG